MTRDYKNSPKRSARGGGSGKTVFTGIVIGLLMGIIIALGIALYLNRSASPFVNKTQQPEPKRPTEAKKPETLKPLASGGAPAEPKSADKPRFDFYEILPGDKDPSHRPAGKPASTEKSVNDIPPPPPPKTPETNVAKPAIGKDNYYLQAGAFRSSVEADSLKARLALMGLEANIETAEVSNVGTMYRVRLGPYQSSDQVNSTKNQLAQNGIRVSVLKFPATQNN